MRQTAVEAYVRGPSQPTVLFLEAESLSEMATKQYMHDVALGEGAEVADELRAAGEDLIAQRAAAEETRELPSSAARRSTVS